MAQAQTEALSCPYALDAMGRNLGREAAMLRTQGPAVQVTLPGGITAWAVVQQRYVERILADDRVSRSARLHWPDFIDGHIQADWPLYPWVANENMFNSYGEQRSRLRRLVAGAFTVRRSEAMRPKVEAITAELLAGLADQGAQAPVDLRARFTALLPMRVICELFGVEQGAATDALCAALHTVFTSSVSAEEMNQALLEAFHLLTAVVERKRVEPGDDLTSALIAARDADDRLTEEELLGTLYLMIAGGMDSPTTLMTNAIAALLTHPEQLEHVRAGRADWNDVIDETLRMHTPGAYSPLRFAVEDIDLDGVLIKKGEPILVSFAAGGLDPVRYGASVAEFDLLRTGRDTLGFGHGAHRCLGAPLARVEAQSAFGELFDRFPDMQLACPADELEPMPTFLMNGFKSLPVLLG
ncbi:cytochrome P450 family protein [Streptomyces indicus]|uniref:Cytochrome P450 n=1 Tax=Streptomyces indicus TaxID=417292 RepID=A0A1G9J3H3_9ACTN|nr:cytochrome P450 [Streptomyces indicus]SDL31881.1 hypothetical protein SAMN05421806_12720 [Streptomyces indicus]